MIQDLSSFVLTVPEALDEKICDALIEWHTSDASDTTMVKTVVADRDTRRDIQKWLPEDHRLWGSIQLVKKNLYGQYSKKFPSVYRGAKSIVMPETKIQCTEPFGGGFHNFHAEVSHWENCARALVWVIYLNDTKPGEGETEFLYQNIKSQPQKGKAVIWPAAWMFQHRGNPVHAQNKYIATGWCWYPEEKGYYG